MEERRERGRGREREGGYRTVFFFFFLFSSLVPSLPCFRKIKVSVKAHSVILKPDKSRGLLGSVSEEADLHMTSMF